MKRIIIPLFLSLLSGFCASATTYYVWPGGRGLKTGLSWADASADLQVMINTADSGDHIWVAKGTYKPGWHADDLTIADPGSRLNAFVLKKDVKVYGGFAGTETVLNARDSISLGTVLSGDFNGDDLVTGSGPSLMFSGTAENAYHVVIAAGYMGSALLDGFKVTGGNSSGSGSNTVNGRTIYKDRGAGIYCDMASLFISNCAIAQNTAVFNGGGIYSDNAASQSLQRCAVMNNNADSSGGGIAIQESVAPILSECAVTGNKAGISGGGIYIFIADSSSSSINCIISNNSAAYGGGMFQFSGGNSMTNCMVEANTASYYGGGIYSLTSPGFSYQNCSFKNNKALSGGGFYYYGTSLVNTRFVRCNISGNRAQNAGGGMYFDGGVLDVWHSTIVEDSAGLGGGVYTLNGQNTLTNCNISRNVADSAGALYYKNNVTPRSILVSNCTITGNVSSDCIRTGIKAAVNMGNSIVWGNSGGVTITVAGWLYQQYSLVQGEPGGLYGNIDGTVDPLFVNAAAGDYRLQSGSPMIEKGSLLLYYGFARLEQDLAGMPRLFADSVDIGAYEYQGAVTGITDLKKADNVLVSAYPNPVTSGNVITLKTGYAAMELNGAFVQLLDMSGKVVLRTAVTASEMSLPVPSVAGVYIGNLQLSDGRSGRFNVIVNK